MLLGCRKLFKWRRRGDSAHDLDWPAFGFRPVRGPLEDGPYSIASFLMRENAMFGPQPLKGRLISRDLRYR